MPRQPSAMLGRDKDRETLRKNLEDATISYCDQNRPQLLGDGWCLGQQMQGIQSPLHPQYPHRRQMILDVSKLGEDATWNRHG